MVKKFRRQKKTYSFVAATRQQKLSKREQAAYRKLFFAIIFLLAISCLLYVKGLDFLTYYSSFWRQESNASEPIPTTIPEELPTAPVINQMPSAIKEDVNLKIYGSAPANSKVSILVNDQEVSETTADIKGTFEVNVENDLAEGINTISAITIDKNGLRSRPAEAQTIILDTKAPDLAVTSPQDQEVIETEMNMFIITGKTESTKITVTINGYRAIVDLDGHFSYSLPLTEGENKIIVQAEDEVGHKTITERVVTYQTTGN
ncbi:hypothetical protein KJ608_01805 [Patescibacteria group bacterium]|nr:hypothetical protein [Patescibacteria group bacterium]